MDVNQYKAERHKFDVLSEQNLKDLAQWAEQQALPWLWAELAGILPGKRTAPLQPREAIRQGLQTTFADREKMPLQPNFYIAQLTMLDAEMKRYCGATTQFIKAVPPRFAPNATIFTLHGAIKEHLDHGIVILEQAGHFLLDLPFAYGAWSRRTEHPFEVFKRAEQAVYGGFSGLTHDDRAPYTPVAVLRTAIELRIRSAFGIQGYIDPTNDNFLPIDLARLFDEIRNHLPKIDFAVDFHDIVKIYRWSNFYLHGGWRDFVWVPGFALQFLRPLFADRTTLPNGGWDIDGGIRMPREVWRAIRGSFSQSRTNSSRCLMTDLWEGAFEAFRRRKRNRPLILNPADEQHAACVLLD